MPRKRQTDKNQVPTSFKEYWDEKKDVLEILGIKRDVAHMIWCDAINAMHLTMTTKILLELTKGNTATETDN